MPLSVEAYRRRRAEIDRQLARALADLGPDQDVKRAATLSRWLDEVMEINRELSNSRGHLEAGQTSSKPQVRVWPAVPGLVEADRTGRNPSLR